MTLNSDGGFGVCLSLVVKHQIEDVFVLSPSLAITFQ